MSALLVAMIALTAYAARPRQDLNERAELVITTDRDEVLLEVEVAVADEERRRGLMGRDHLAPNNGMAFVFNEAVSSGFWMKDTALPLSIAFVSAEGLILDIQDMEPYSLAIHNIQEPYSYALEVNQGWYDRHGIAAGDVVQLPPLSSPQ